MIPVGLRLPEEVFFEPEEPIAKLPNNATESPTMILDGVDKDGTMRIKRIILTRPANVELLRAESPSKIWVRLQNHITDNTLTFREPFPLKQYMPVKINDYALAPIEDRVYRRCRILERLENGLIKVFFIDDGTVGYVKKECLAVMEPYYMYFPWQAIQISMFSISPAYGSCDSEPGELQWSSEICEELDKVLEEFPLFRVDPVLSSVVFNDYARATPVKLSGIKNKDAVEKDKVRQSMSIADILTERIPMSLECMNLFDAAYQEFYPTMKTEKIPDQIEKFQSSFPMDWKHESVEEELKKAEKEKKLFAKDSMTPEMEENEWNPAMNEIQALTKKELTEKYTFPENGPQRIMLALEGKCTKSPAEWYARPIVKVGKNQAGELAEWEEGMKEVDRVDWMLFGNDQVSSFAEQLDTYYSDVKNRRPLRGDEIQALHRSRKNVYAVCAVNEDKAMYTGEWQRVLIVKCEDFAEVQFLDSGGRDMVLTSSLYRIHKQHCRFPPMCLRLSMTGVKSKNKENAADGAWEREEISDFKLCLREDVPIFIDVSKFSVGENGQVEVPDVHYKDEAKSVKQRFLQK